MKSVFLIALLALLASNAIVQARLSVPQNGKNTMALERHLAVKKSKKRRRELALKSIRDSLRVNDLGNDLREKFGIKVGGFFDKIASQEFMNKIAENQKF